MQQSLENCNAANADAQTYAAVVQGVATVLREQRARLAAIVDGRYLPHATDELSIAARQASGTARRARVQAMGTAAVPGIIAYREALQTANGTVDAGRAELSEIVRCLDHALDEADKLTGGFTRLHGLLDEASDSGQRAIG